LIFLHRGASRKSSASYKDAKSRAAALDANLRADDPRLRHAVHLQHHDGTVLFYNSAFVVRWQGWLIVLTEHHGPHVYHPEDLHAFGMYRAVRRIEAVHDE
jgi:hypothetical protein